MPAFEKKYQKYRLYFLTYLPCAVVLIFSMMALHFPLEHINNAEITSYSKQYDKGASLSESETQPPSLINFNNNHSWLYWSVFGLGLSGFVLVLINAYNVLRLRNANLEKQNTLKLLQERLAALEATFEGIGIIDPDGNLTYMNPALMELHGIPKDQKQKYIGQSWLKLYTQKGQKIVKETVIPVLQEKGMWSDESPLVRLDGEIVHAQMSLQMLPDGGMIGVARNISHIKKSDQEKQDLQDQFYQAQKMEAIGRLAGGIAHDFNNILAAINGYAEFLVEDLEPSTPQHKFADSILKAGEQARSLIDQILAFSRRKPSEHEGLDLLKVIEESRSMLSATLPKTIELKTNIDLENALITGNSTQVLQAIMNLCVNAQDAMEKEHGEITISVREKKADMFKDMDILTQHLPGSDEAPVVKIEDVSPGHTRLVLSRVAKDVKYASITISDTGTGMSRAIMEHVFEPFFTTKAVDKGTGLGLATVHGVITAHQACMIINSELGRGTSFELLFPLHKEEAQEQQIHEIDTAGFEDAHLLLVEDQDEVRDMTLNMLERCGFTVECCSSALQALAILRENPGVFNLVITDHNMPKMTGLELIQQIHFDDPHLKFIMVSGYSEEKLKDLIDEHPAIHCVLRKPVSRKHLNEKILEALSMQKMAA